MTRARREGWDGEDRGHCRKGKQCQERGLGRVGSVPGLCSGLTEEAWEGMTGAAAGEVCRGRILRGLRRPTKEVTSSEDLVKQPRLTNRCLSSADVYLKDTHCGICSGDHRHGGFWGELGGKDSWPLGTEIMTLVCCCLAHTRCSGFVASERGCYKIPGRNAKGGGSDNRREVLLERHSQRDMDEIY